MKNTEIIDYKMIRSTNGINFEQVVRDALADGWVLFGKFQVIPVDSYESQFGYSRELVKYKDANISKTGETK